MNNKEKPTVSIAPPQLNGEGYIIKVVDEHSTNYLAVTTNELDSIVFLGGLLLRNHDNGADEELGELVKDLTKVGSIPKSEAVRRIGDYKNKTK